MEPAVPVDDLTLLRRQWPATILLCLTWRQTELDGMRTAAKQRYRNSRAGACSYCGKWIKCDMYRHVSTFHLELAQLWRCPVSWYTVWKGTQQDCMDHVRGAHIISPYFLRTSGMGTFFMAWTVQREIWPDALKPCYSGISTHVLLFSEMSLTLVHHYRVFRRGLPHISLRRNYLTRLGVFVLQSFIMDQVSLSSPAPASSVSPRNIGHRDAEAGSPCKSRRIHHQGRPTRVQDCSVNVLSPVVGKVANQPPGTVVYDCRPRIIPFSIQLGGGGGGSQCPCIVRSAASSTLAAPPVEEVRAAEI